MNLDIRNNTLYFGGINTVELAKKYNTPLYIIDERILTDKIRDLKENFLNKYDNVKVLYASKAFLNTAICKIIKKEGIGLDVVSNGELYTALNANMSPDDIIFHGNNKSIDELKMAIDNNVSRIIVDSMDELEDIIYLTNKLQKSTDIMFRITPDVRGKTHDYISTGQKDSKFGIPLEFIIEACKTAINSEYINLKGLHFHTGSQLFSNESHLKALRVAFSIIEDLKSETKYIIEELNVGGGFGVFYSDDDKEMDFTHFTDEIMELCEELANELEIKRPKIMIEPGRWIISKAGITLYEIGNTKDIKGIRKYASVDGGITDNIRPALYNASYTCMISNKADEESVEKVTICGKCCESGDVIIKDAELPKVQKRDILTVFSTGAYNESMSSNYNKLLRPAVVMLKDSKDYLIKRREELKDLVSRDVVPEFLQDI